MKRLIPILILSLLFSCEKEVKQLPDDLSDKKVEDNSTIIASDVSTETKTAAIPPPLAKEAKSESTKTPDTESATEPVVLLPTTDSIVLPEFSEALLNAVGNWTNIPRSVFPLSSVTINKSVNFSVKSSSGDTIAQSSLPPGSEVVAVGASGQNLLIAPSKNAKMKGFINIDDTDFKQGVAYLFELRKKQMAEYKRQQESKLSQKTPVTDLQTPKKVTTYSKTFQFPEILGTVSFVSAMTAGQKELISIFNKEHGPQKEKKEYQGCGNRRFCQTIKIDKW